MSLGNNILKIRTDNGLTQEQFAEMLSVSRQSVSKWELDQALPETDKVLLISKLFSVSTDEILLGRTASVKSAEDINCSALKAERNECKTISFEQIFTEDISAITLDTSSCNIYFHNSENKELKVRIYAEHNNYSVNIDDNSNLTITSKDKQKSETLISRIEIYLPADYDSEIKIDNKFGNVTFDSAKYINVSVNKGNVKIFDEVKGADINCNLGNIEIGIVEERMELSNSYGNISIGFVSLKKDSFVRAALGNISIGRVENANIDAFSSLGDVTVSNKYPDSDITLNLCTNTGNISVS